MPKRSSEMILRGPKTRKEQLAAVTRFEPLVKKHAGRYASLLGFDDARSIAYEGVLAAIHAWNPCRGPIEAIVAYYVATALSNEAQKHQRRDGVATQDRARIKRMIATGSKKPPTKPLPSYSVVSNVFIGEGGKERDVFDLMSDGAPGADEMLAAADRVAGVRRAVAKLNGSRALVEEILADDGSVEQMERSLGKLKPSKLRQLREAFAALRPSLL